MASGALKSCDPDRIVVKKIVLTGIPVRTHKAKATVKYMFHNPGDAGRHQRPALRAWLLLGECVAVSAVLF